MADEDFTPRQVIRLADLLGLPLPGLLRISEVVEAVHTRMSTLSGHDRAGLDHLDEAMKACAERDAAEEALMEWWKDPDNPPAYAAQLAAKRGKTRTRCACGAYAYSQHESVTMQVVQYGYHSPSRCEVEGPGQHVDARA